MYIILKLTNMCVGPLVVETLSMLKMDSSNVGPTNKHTRPTQDNSEKEPGGRGGKAEGGVRRVGR